MSCVKAVMAVGDFTVELDEGTPDRILRDIDPATMGYGCLIITPQALDLIDLSTPSDLLDESCFTGLYRDRGKNLHTLQGTHVTGLLGDQDGKGDNPEVTIGGFAAQTLDKYTGARPTTFGLRPATIGAGNLNATVATILYVAPALKTPRQQLTEIHDLFSNAGTVYEWRVTDQLTLDSGTIAQVYADSRAVMLTGEVDGDDPQWIGLHAEMVLEETLDDYTERVRVERSDGFSDFWPNPAGATRYQTILGVDVQINRDISADGEPDNAGILAQAKAQLARFSDLDRRLTVTVDDKAVMADVDCGQYVHAFDLGNGIYDLANNYEFRGCNVRPLKLRCTEVEMPIEDGMGVYLANSTSVVELHPYVKWENPGATLTVGAPNRDLRTAFIKRDNRAGY